MYLILLTHMKNNYSILSIIIIATVFFSCEKDDPVVTNISIPSEVTLDVGNTKKITVTHTPSSLPAPSYVWETSDNSIFIVDNSGNITGLKVGEGTLTVKAPKLNLTASCKVKVIPINATSISLSQQSATLLLGSSLKLVATILPENVTDKTILWKSGNETIATVANDGTVQAVGMGKTTITASIGSLEASCEITVDPIKVTGITLSKQNIALEITDQIKIDAIINPDNATNKKVIWQSKNPNIAEVDDNGNITGVNEGNTVVTAKTEDGNFSASCNVTVNLKGLRLTMSDITMLPNTEELIWVLYSTSDKAYINATWSSSNPNVARVTGDGPGTNSAVVKALSIGTTIITATSADGKKAASCTVVVQEINDAVTLIANPQKGRFGIGMADYTIGCRFTNPTNSTVFINSVILIDDSNQGIQITAPEEKLRNLSNNSFVILFDPITIYGTFQEQAIILAKYRVLVQYSINGKDYDKFEYVNPNKFGGLY
ncbi:MAG: Ig-like domain-containing protein [Acutalibacteraceae bacterium]